MSPPSMRARTGRMRIVSRVSFTSSGSLRSLRWILRRTAEFTGPRILSTAWLRVRPCTGSSSICVMMSLARMPARAAGVSSIGRDDLDEALLHRDLDAEAAELAAGLHLHVAEALRVHVARMRIERGQHAVDGRFDQLRLVGLLDVVGADLLEHVAEQAELAVGLGGGRHRARARQQMGLRHERRAAGAGDGADEKKGQFAHQPRTFSLCDFAHHGPGSIEPPSLRNST